MTLIECFTKSHIDNMGACLRLQPEKLIMVGPEETMTDPVKRYQKLLQRRGQAAKITMCDVQGKDFGGICHILYDLVRKEAPCVIDLTGGDEPVIMAVGAVLAELDEDMRHQIRVEKFDPSISTVVDCMDGNRPLSYGPVRLTIAELIELHGGCLLADSYQPSQNCSYRDISGLWQVVAEAPKDWNRTIPYLNEFENRGDSGMQVYLPMEDLRDITDFERKESDVRSLLDQLHQACAVDDHSNWDALDYTYTSALMRYCTRKAGNVLETKTLLEGRAVTENGMPFFQDCRMSVSIDWDGVISSKDKHKPETRNEIDVVLMHGMTPLFISCKNGNIGEELYKLHTVAERFGGPYAKKMLIATDLDQTSSSTREALRRRAWDMDILLVTDAGSYSHKEWAECLLRAMDREV